MKAKVIINCLLVCTFLVQLSSINAQNTWNQFRGPNRNGAITPASIPDILPADGPELLWKKEIGAGFSEVTVWGDSLYTMLAEPIDTSSGWEYVVAFEAVSGKEIWKTKVDSMFFDQFGDGPRSTLVIDEHHVYSFSSYGKLSAIAKSNGAVVWQVDFMKEYGSVLPRWAFSSSPALVGNTLVIEAGGSESRGFMGFDKENGQLLWAKGEGVASYTSPVVAEIDGVKQVIFANQTNLFSFNSMGDTLWTHPMTMNGPMSSPVFYDSNKIFVSTVRSDGFSVFEVKDNMVSEVLTGSTMKNDFSSSLYYEGHIYGFDVAALQCISAETGEKKWTKRGFGKGSLILVENKLLVLSDKGVLVQIEAKADGYTEQGRFQALDGKSWTAPSFTDGKLYVRNLTEMACYKLK